jgi:hypothetical protein
MRGIRLRDGENAQGQQRPTIKTGPRVVNTTRLQNKTFPRFIGIPGILPVATKRLTVKEAARTY